MTQSKNCWVIPTDKPSRIYKVRDILYFEEYPDKTVIAGNQNIYITNDEEIKEGDWGYCKSRNKICKVTGISKWTHKDDYSIDLDNENYFIHHSYCKKIILTTDPNLVKEGVQPIPDEFLEWFVKNPSCEEVEIGNDQYKIFNSEWKNFYKIIIPKEEPKPVWQQIIDTCGGEEEFMKSAGLLSKQECKDCNKSLEECTCIEDTIDMKIETLEIITEQIQKECHSFVDSVPNVTYTNVTYQDATNIFLFIKLAELTLKLRKYEK